MIKLQACDDMRSPQNELIETCQGFWEHRQRLAIGMGLIGKNPPVPSEVLMGVTLVKYPRCSELYQPRGVAAREDRPTNLLRKSLLFRGSWI